MLDGLKVQQIQAVSGLREKSVSKMTGGPYIAEFLAGYGVKAVFLVPTILSRALAEMDEIPIKRVLTHGEKAAVYMADGYAGQQDGQGFVQGKRLVRRTWLPDYATLSWHTARWLLSRVGDGAIKNTRGTIKRSMIFRCSIALRRPALKLLPAHLGL
jgi:hypothetical protein